VAEPIREHSVGSVHRFGMNNLIEMITFRRNRVA
jgi:hypothetical protein